MRYADKVTAAVGLCALWAFVASGMRTGPEHDGTCIDPCNDPRPKCQILCDNPDAGTATDAGEDGGVELDAGAPDAGELDAGGGTGSDPDGGSSGQGADAGPGTDAGSDGGAADGGQLADGGTEDPPPAENTLRYIGGGYGCGSGTQGALSFTFLAALVMGIARRRARSRPPEA